MGLTNPPNGKIPYQVVTFLSMRFDAPLDDLLTTRSSIGVLRALDELPAGFGVSARELARRAGISHPTATKFLGSLAEQGLVFVKRSPSGDEYSFNRDHVLAEELGRLFGRERGLLDEFISFLGDAIVLEAPLVEQAFLFGSVIEGGMTTTSDIDVAVLCSPQWEIQVETGMRSVAERVRSQFGNQLNVLVGSTKPKRSPVWSRILKRGRPIPLPRKGGRRKGA
jgi:predicted nucleotidyltransferase